MKAAIYARYSSDRQRESSIDDQVRNCTRYAERERLSIGRVYKDEAISGAVTARPGYQQMLAAAAAGGFGVLLVDDLSRLSRDELEMKRVLRTFSFQGLRVVGVLDGYDSSRKGHKLQASIYGIKNELYLDDLRDKTHSGMMGKAEDGYSCGGRTYGYRNIPIEDPLRRDAHGRPAVVAVRYEVDPTQAEIVQRIHAWYASGHSYRWIAAELNRQALPSARGGIWATSAIKVILENEMYEGRLTWNRRAWVKHPDTGKRTYRTRPREEWIATENASLRIVSPETISAVRSRQERNRQAYTGTIVVPLSQRYLLSGLMTCAECGGNFVIVAKGRYGCAWHKSRGSQACRNQITVSRHVVEDRVLNGIKTQLLEPGNLKEFKRAAMELIDRHNSASKDEDIRRQLKAAERVRGNVLEAIKQGIITPTTKEALEEAEAAVADLKVRLDHVGNWNVSAILPRALERYRQAVEQFEQRVGDRVEPAREILRSLIGENIRIHRRGDHLEAEVPSHVPSVLAASMGPSVDAFGCGGPIRNAPHFVSLEPRTSDCAPLIYRNGIPPATTIFSAPPARARRHRKRSLVP